MKNQEKPNFAPGDDAKLEQQASKQEVKRGDSTKVTQLSFDEVGPS